MLLVAVSLLVVDGIWSFKTKIHSLATETIVVIEANIGIGWTHGGGSRQGIVITRKRNIEWIVCCEKS
jgi:hypothetical protein